MASSRLFLLAYFTAAAFSCPLHSQDHSDSPIFKSYRPPSPSALLKRSDVSYNLLQIFILERRSYSGDVLAQHELGLRYLLGEGVEADTIKGAFWIQRAAEGGLTDALYNSGILYFNGMGVEWNPFKAYREFLVSAQQGSPEAQYILSMFLTENLVVPRNWQEAYRWLKEAASVGYSPAKEALAEFEQRGLGVKRTDKDAKSDTGSQGKKQAIKQTLGFVFQDAGVDTSSQSDAALLKDALREASPQLKRALGLTNQPSSKLDLDTPGLKVIQDAAEEGSPEALSILGRAYERGVGVKKDLVLASVYYIRASRMSSLRAPALLARMIDQPEYFRELKSRVERNDPDAEFAWAALAALKLDYLLAKYQGFITEPQALEFLKNAAAANHIQATIELGLCYYAGRWVPENREQALALWNKAASLGSIEARTRLAALAVRSESDSTKLKQAIDVLESAAQRGSVLAQVALGYCYETGTWLPKKAGEAARLYRSAAQRGSQDAYFALRRMHDRIRPKDKEFQLNDFEQLDP
jgi:TPR repeat protein